METLVRDLRVALRRLRKTPGFTLIAVLSLALGIGANTAVFSLVNAVLLRDPAVERPEELVEVHATTPDFPFIPFSYPEYEEFREATGEIFSGLAASQLTLVPHDLGDRIESVPAEMVNGGYFDALGVRPAAGRLFSAREDDVSPGAHPVVVLSHDYWESAFGRDAGVIGREIRLSGRPYTVVGVAPREFEGSLRGLAPSLYLPVLMINQLQPGASDQLAARGNHSIFLTARLRPGVSLAQAEAAASTFLGDLVEAHPEAWPGSSSMVLTPRNDVYVSPMLDGFIVSAAALLLGVVALVLLIACANLASFLLAQARERRREIAVRLALGAPRSSLVRQLLTESVALALAGGALGILLARLLLDLLTGADLPLPLPITLDLSLDARVLAFAFAASLGAGVLFGLAPAIQSTRPDVLDDIKSENTGGGPRGRVTLRGALVVGQIAVSMLLLVTTGLFLRSLGERQDVDPGFGRDPAAVVTFAVPSDRYSVEEARRFVRRLEERVGEIPGVEGVGVIDNLHLNPLSTNNLGVNVDGHEPPEGARDFLVDRAAADPGFFAAAGIPLVRGRNFQDTDVEGAPSVAIVNEVMAEKFWPGEDPVGRVFRTGDGEVTVVGVARNAKIRTLGEEPRPFVYFPYSQRYSASLWLVATTRGDAERTLVQVLEAARSMDRDLMILQSRTMEGHLAGILLPARLSALIFSAFAGLALVLAIIGIYGVVSYAVTRRSREVGIRLSLGAQPASVVRLLMGTGVRLVLGGLAIGLALAAAAARLLEGFLYGVAATDPVTFVATPLLLGLVGVLAAYLPARRATRVDPVVVLKAD